MRFYVDIYGALDYTCNFTMRFYFNKYDAFYYKCISCVLVRSSLGASAVLSVIPSRPIEVFIRRRSQLAELELNYIIVKTARSVRIETSPLLFFLSIHHYLYPPHLFIFLSLYPILSITMSVLFSLSPYSIPLPKPICSVIKLI